MEYNSRAREYCLAIFVKDLPCADNPSGHQKIIFHSAKFFSSILFVVHKMYFMALGNVVRVYPSIVQVLHSSSIKIYITNNTCMCCTS